MMCHTRHVCQSFDLHIFKLLYPHHFFVLHYSRLLFFSWSKVPWRRLVCYTARRVIAVARQKGGVGKNTAIDLVAAPMLGDHATVVFDPRGTATTGHRA